MKHYKIVKKELELVEKKTCDSCGDETEIIIDLGGSSISYGELIETSRVVEHITVSRHIFGDAHYEDCQIDTLDIDYDFCAPCFVKLIQKPLNEKGIKGTCKHSPDWGQEKTEYKVVNEATFIKFD